MISLNEHDMRARLSRILPQGIDQPGRDAAPPIRLGYRQIIDVDFAARLLELVELIGDQPTGHLPVKIRHQCKDVGLCKLRDQIIVGGWRSVIRRVRIECSVEQIVQTPHRAGVVRANPPNLHSVPSPCAPDIGKMLSGPERERQVIVQFGDNWKDTAMLWTIAVILVILWLLGFGLNIAGGLIHILLVIALIVGLVQLFTGRRV